MKKGLFYAGAVVFCAAVMSGSAFAWGSTKNIDEPSEKISAAEEAALSMPSSDEVKSAVQSVKEAIADAANKGAEAVEEATKSAPTGDEAKNDVTSVAANDASSDAAKNTEAASATESDNTAAQPADTMEYCPDASQLHKEDMLWYAKNGGWRSFDASFVDDIKAFSGAQWIGVEVGKVICMYQGKDASAFPVTIERDNLVDDIKPGTGKWGKDMGGYKHCESNNPKDCGFVMHHGKQKEEDVYKVLRGLKKAIDNN